MDPFSAIVGILLMLGGAFFIIAPRMRWYRERVESEFGERSAAILDDRARWYRMLGYAIGLVGLVRFVTA